MLQRAQDDGDDVEFNELLDYLISKDTVFMGLLPLCQIALVSSVTF